MPAGKAGLNAPLMGGGGPAAAPAVLPAGSIGGNGQQALSTSPTSPVASPGTVRYPSSPPDPAGQPPRGGSAEEQQKRMLMLRMANREGSWAHHYDHAKGGGFIDTGTQEMFDYWGNPTGKKAAATDYYVRPGWWEEYRALNNPTAETPAAPTTTPLAPAIPLNPTPGGPRKDAPPLTEAPAGPPQQQATPLPAAGPGTPPQASTPAPSPEGGAPAGVPGQDQAQGAAAVSGQEGQPGTAALLGPQPGTPGGPPLELDRIPSAAERAALMPGATINTPFGVMDSNGELTVSPQGAAAYQQAHQAKVVSFGPHPWANDPNAPPPPVKLGRYSINPFTGRWS